MAKYIMAIDQGTTQTKVSLVDCQGNMICSANKEIRQIYRKPGWVEHDPMEYWRNVIACAKQLFSEQNQAKQEDILAVAITNQRETVIMWDRVTSKPVYNAIVWQCRRTVSICEKLQASGWEKEVRKRTGLFLDPYFSGTKIKWIIDNVKGVKESIKNRRLVVGCVDSWLIWHLSQGKLHVTDYSNASRTMLFNVRNLCWDNLLLNLLEIPRGILPEVKPSSGILGYTNPRSFLGIRVPIASVVGDAHAALFGQTCFSPGMTKVTYGTGLTVMLNIGDKFILSKNGLMTDLTWYVNGKVQYCLEGVAFNGGAAIQWLRDGLKVIRSVSETNEIAKLVPDTGGVYVVPAFTGLCAPYWDTYARGIIIGITRGTTREHIIRATLESLAYRTRDIIDAMSSDSGIVPQTIIVDGGAANNDFLMQFQADILGVAVLRPKNTEAASIGTAYLAGLAMGFWKNKKEIEKKRNIERTFEPKLPKNKRDKLYYNWKRAVERSLSWV